VQGPPRPKRKTQKNSGKRRRDESPILKGEDYIYLIISWGGGKSAVEPEKKNSPFLDRNGQSEGKRLFNPQKETSSSPRRKEKGDTVGRKETLVLRERRRSALF